MTKATEVPYEEQQRANRMTDPALAQALFRLIQQPRGVTADRRNALLTSAAMRLRGDLLVNVLAE